MRSVQHSLNSMAPKVFTMQLAWQSANETREDIAHTLGGLREVCLSRGIFSMLYASV